MKRFSIFLILLFACLSINAQKMQDVVYMKNGSVIRGLVMEQIPDSIIKIGTSDGSIFVFQTQDVVKITKEPSKKYWGNNVNIYRPKGYRWFLDLGGGVGDGGFLELTSTHGYQFNPYLFVGGGAGALTDTWAVLFPFYANVHSNLLNNRISPFLDMRMGGALIVDEGAYGDFYFSFSAGVNYQWKPKLGINASLGYCQLECAWMYLKIGLEF